MDGLWFFPIKNLMWNHGPKNLMWFNGHKFSNDLMDPMGPSNHMCAQLSPKINDDLYFFFDLVIGLESESTCAIICFQYFYPDTNLRVWRVTWKCSQIPLIYISSPYNKVCALCRAWIVVKSLHGRKARQITASDGNLWVSALFFCLPPTPKIWYYCLWRNYSMGECKIWSTLPKWTHQKIFQSKICAHVTLRIGKIGKTLIFTRNKEKSLRVLGWIL